MKILKLTAENVKKLRAVEIAPDGSIVQLTGKNGSGKSSVLDAIFYALAGTAGIPSKPIRNGEQSAKVRLDLGEIIVTRKFTDTGSTLTVEGSNGARFPSPQKMLDDLIGTISFDPLAFMRMEPKEQSDLLRRLVKLEVDFDALAGLNKRDYEARTEINRQAKSLRTQAAAITVPTDLPEETISVDALIERLDKAGEENTLLERRRAGREQASRDADTLEARAAEAKDRAKALRDQAAAADREADDLAGQAKAGRDKLAKAEALPKPVDTSEIRASIEKAKAVNRAIEDRTKKRKLEKDAAAAETQSDALSQTMTGRDAAKAEAVKKAKMPVPGLAFGENGMLYNGLPLEQASSAEQLRVSAAIAMAGNPKLRVLRIKEGSLLDEDSLALLRTMAEAEDFQIWIECVDSTGKVGIVMEDGSIKGAVS